MKMAHLSEVGLWKKTRERKPEDVIQTILGSVPREPFTVVVLESTAKGIGNFFPRYMVRGGGRTIGLYAVIRGMVRDRHIL